MNVINNTLSVVTVTYNNAEGLSRTLRSILKCLTKPKVIHVVDGNSQDSTKDVITKYSQGLNIVFTSEPDQGIYDAMNKGKQRVVTKYVHYLNAGDEVFGDPYSTNYDTPYTLDVHIEATPNSKWKDHIKLLGYGYNHQGIVFSSDHLPYDLNLSLAADFDLVCRTYPSGLKDLPRAKNGFVNYKLGGVSSIGSTEGKRQVLTSAKKNLSKYLFFRIYLIISIQRLFPRFLRQILANVFWRS